MDDYTFTFKYPLKDSETGDSITEISLEVPDMASVIEAEEKVKRYEGLKKDAWHTAYLASYMSGIPAKTLIKSKTPDFQKITEKIASLMQGEMEEPTENSDFLENRKQTS